MRRKRRGRVSKIHGLRLDERARRTERVLARFRDKPFDWHGANCIRLAAAQAKALGHKVPPVPLFRSAQGARAALAKQGADSVVELLDRHFERWPTPAFARLGDLCALPGAQRDDDEEPDPALQCVCIADGQGNLFGWHPDREEGLSVIKFALADVLVAWRL